MITEQFTSDNGMRDIILQQNKVAYYGAYKWTNIWGQEKRTGAGYYATRDEAQAEAKRLAILSGWTPRKWYQFWRWSETP